MNIAINTLPLYNTKVGMGKYIVELVNKIPQIDKNSTYFFYVSQENANFFQFQEKNIILKKVPVSLSSPFGKLVWEHIFLPFSLWKNKIVLYHAPGFVLPFFKLNKNIKFIITLADMTFFSHPQYHMFWKQKYFKYMIPRSIHKADKVIAISESTKKDILKHVSVDEKKIMVTHLGYDTLFSKQSINKIIPILKKYNINFPYILFVGMLEPRKNVPSLIKAFAAIKNKQNHMLVIVGKKGWQYDKIFDWVQKLKLEQQVVFTGYVPDEHLSALYSGATCFVYPSFYEGFGIPIIEAMACGCPVITSNNSSMEEIAGDAAILVDPYDVQTITRAIETYLYNNDERKKRAKQGIKYVKRFSWETMVKKTEQIYKELLKGT